MSWVTKTLSSSIGKKVLMALTGIFLCTFLIVHMVGNLQLFKDDGGFAFNEYAVLMTTNPFIKFVSYGLYAMILFHAFWGFYLEVLNRKARPQRYAVVNNSSSWASRNMAILGTILLVYIAVHMGDFWYDYKFGYVPFKEYVQEMKTGEIISQRSMEEGYVQEVKVVEYVDQETDLRTIVIKDLYAEVSESFRNPLLVVFYVLSMVALSYHLVHGFQSAFQSLGLNHPKYTPLIKNLGVWVFAILIPLAFAAMPLYFLVK